MSGQRGGIALVPSDLETSPKDHAAYEAASVVGALLGPVGMVIEAAASAHQLASIPERQSALEPGRTVVGDLHSVPLELDHLAERVGAVGVVLDHEDAPSRGCATAAERLCP